MKMIIFEKTFEALPLGTIKPAGWLKNQLEIQASGMTGMLEEYWSDVGPNNGWLGGNGDGWERGPYYLDGAIPLAYLLGDEDLIHKTQKWIDWILNSQDHSGWFGPKENDDWWSRMIVAKVLTQYYEVTEDKQVIDFLTSYYKYQLKELGNRPLTEWGKARGGENILSILWLYEKTKEPYLIELMSLIRNQSTNWYELYDDLPFKRYVEEFNHESHVVNVAMSLKYLALDYLVTNDERYIERLDSAIDQLYLYHGQLHGMFSGDEWLAGTHPSQGTELCSIVEFMFSMEIIISVLGKSKFGDLLERVAFNALPAAISRDWRSHQYDQQVNQVSCTREKRNWTENNDDANTFGLEPHFGCCTANMHQGWPKFVSHLWMKDEEGLVCQSYSPCYVNYETIKQHISLNITTSYPFDEAYLIKLTMKEPEEFKLKFRWPIWCHNIEIKINNQAYKVNNNNGYFQIERTWKDGDEISIRLFMEVTLEKRAQSAIGVTRGPLLFSLPIEEKWSVYNEREFFNDWEVTPISDWQFALNSKNQFKVEKTKNVTNQIFDSLNSPISIETTGYFLDNWHIDKNSAATPPYNIKKGRKKIVRLVPYGGAKLRISEFPTVDPRP